MTYEQAMQVESHALAKVLTVQELKEQQQVLADEINDSGAATATITDGQVNIDITDTERAASPQFLQPFRDIAVITDALRIATQ